MPADLASLPPELLRSIMHHLPIPALFALGQTAHYPRAVQLTTLTTLQLGIFPSRIDSIFSTLDGAATTYDPTRNVQIVLPKADGRTKDAVIREQNARSTKILRQEPHQNGLRDVELALWELQRSTAQALTGLRRLRSLAVRCDHPHTQHPRVDRKYWHTAPGSTVWNHFYASPNRQSTKNGPQWTTTAAEPILGNLERLTLERAGISDYQLRKILAENPSIRELRLRRCRTLTAETFEYLARSDVGQRLEVLHFTHSDGEEIDARILEYIGQMPRLRELSLRGCANLTNAEVEARRKEWAGVREVGMPWPEEGGVVRIEVDPAYK